VKVLLLSSYLERHIMRLAAGALRRTRTFAPHSPED